MLASLKGGVMEWEARTNSGDWQCVKRINSADAYGAV